MNCHSKDVNLKFGSKQSSCLDVRSKFVYCYCLSYCINFVMVTITRLVFFNVFQTEHFPAVKFAMGYVKNMNFFLITKSPEVWKKKVEKIRLASFNWHSWSSWSYELTMFWKPCGFPQCMLLYTTEWCKLCVACCSNMHRNVQQFWSLFWLLLLDHLHPFNCNF